MNHVCKAPSSAGTQESRSRDAGIWTRIFNDLTVGRRVYEQQH
jgi:hypothetical protein